MTLIKNRSSEARRYLVYSSTGNYAQVSSWLAPNREYDVWITHYSSDNSPFESQVEFLNYRAGGKFQNLHDAMANWPELFEQYDYIWVTDDDIALPPSAINKLFRLTERYQLNVAQPAFDIRGKISLKITKEQPWYRYRTTNFVEMTCPIIDMSSLRYFMNHFDIRLTGYGTDWLLMHHLSSQANKRFGVIDKVRCLNPHDNVKNSKREIDQLQSHADRKKVYNQVKKELGLTVDNDGAVNLNYYRDYNVLSVFYRMLRKNLFDKVANRIRRYF